MVSRSLIVLTVAALLEVGGDAVIRRGLQGRSAALLLAGGAILAAYGVVVNLPGWDFGRLLGVYVAIFFVLAQVIDAVAFGARPTHATLLGGALVVAGGIVMVRGRIGP